MSRAQIKRDLSRIKRAANIDFTRQAYEEALERHLHRLDTVTYVEFIRDEKRALRKGTINDDDDEPLTEEDIAQAESEIAAAKANDTPQQWRQDQATIENYHLEKFGHLSNAKRLKAFGGNHKEMWRHYMTLYTEGVREADIQSSGPSIGGELERDRREKPVRLHPEMNRLSPEFEAILGPQKLCYTPEYADGAKHPELAHNYPYKDFPEFDGNTVIEYYAKRKS
jgi:hypothetical protein